MDNGTFSYHEPSKGAFMNNATRYFSVGAVILAFSGMIQSASGIAYTFWQAGWQGGGELTGSFEVDENTPPGFPGTTFVSNDALISFQAHWSGNSYSAPYDWDLSQITHPFMWDTVSHRLVDMQLGNIEAGGPVYCDPFLRVLWDIRLESIDFNPNEADRYHATEGLQGNIVPDGGSTLPLLGIALACLLFPWSLRRLRPA